jgi:serine/threonine protein kinase/tetratricopeptide (TPR) repeat protein
MSEPTAPPPDDALDPTLGMTRAPETAPSHGSAHAASSAVAASAPPPDFIGAYRILERIGAGGMGEVYLAEQTHPIRREVALKIIRQGMDSRDVVARFEAERQALALMNHPRIARVFDAGTTPQGQPFFAMEYVSGLPITEYCDRNRLGIRERLELFIQVCDGVQHAHQKAIIHRDLKPSNILVTTGPPPEPKIIDFGIAKATAQPLTEQTMFTAVGQIIGTPDYMSPEQAEITTEDIDTRADIYSLGVVLYELLVGARPFSAYEFRAAGLEGMLRHIREVEPPRPSARVATIIADAQSDAARAALQRGTEMMRLRGALRGDLDWITMKALEKDRARRYESASAFAADIRRYLDHEAVLASPPSATYRLQKMARRHRAAFIALGVIAAVLAGATVVSTSLFLRAQRESARARNEAARAAQTASFMTSMLEGAGPSAAMGRDTKMLREILDRTNERVGTELADQPEVEAQMRGVLSDTYLDIGELEISEKQAVRAADLLKAARGERDSTTLAAMARLGVVAVRNGRFGEAESLLLRVNSEQRALLGDEHRDVLLSRNALAESYAYEMRSAETESLGRINVPLMRRVLGDNNLETQQAMYNLAVAYADLGKYAESESIYTSLLAVTEHALGPDHPNTLSAKMNYGWMCRLAGRNEDAARLTSEALDGMRRVMGNEHPETLVAINNLAVIYKTMGRLDEAEPLYIENVETSKRVMGAEHPETVASMVNLASLYVARERWRDAEELADQAIAIFTRVMPPEFFGKAVARSIRGECRARRGDLAGAEEDLLAAYAVFEEQTGGTGKRAMDVRTLLADICEKSGRPEEAARWRAAPSEDDATRDEGEAAADAGTAPLANAALPDSARAR